LHGDEGNERGGASNYQSPSLVQVRRRHKRSRSETISLFQFIARCIANESPLGLVPTRVPNRNWEGGGQTGTEGNSLVQSTLTLRARGVPISDEDLIKAVRPRDQLRQYGSEDEAGRARRCCRTPFGFPRGAGSGRRRHVRGKQHSFAKRIRILKKIR